MLPRVDRLGVLVTLLVVVLALPVIARADSFAEPLWVQARKALAGSRNLVADVVATDMEMFDGDGQSMGSMTIQEKISEWQNGEPVRKIFSNTNPEHASAAKARFKITVDNHPDQGLREAITLERAPSGKVCAVFLFTGRKDKITYQGKIWMLESSGMPFRIVYDVDGLPMTKSMRQTITYEMDAQGRVLPVTTLVDTTVSMLFQKVRIVSKYRFHSWIARPG